MLTRRLVKSHLRVCSLCQLQRYSRFNGHRHQDRDQKQQSSRNYFLGKGLVLLSASAFVVSSSKAEDSSSPNIIREGLPVYSRDEISKHKTKESGIWVSYKRGVYDVTEFVESHPGGGERLLLAAGGDLEPFWSLYAQHQTEQVHAILESMRIGNTDPKEAQQAKSRDSKDPYGNEPERHPALVVRQQKPFNAESPPTLLVQEQITKQPLFFVRNHLPVPEIEEKDYSLSLEFDKDLKAGTSFSLKDLKSKFKHRTVQSTIQCTGNRRDDLNKIQEVKGLKWAGTAISNGEFTGVFLRDVLLSFGLSESELRSKYKHVHFEGYDSGPDGSCYAASIPLYKALGPDNEVVLAWGMNGEPLSRDHGYPLRVVVPGVTGARCVKWVKAVRLSERESDSHWQQKDYKMFNSSTTWDNVDWHAAPSVHDTPVTCAVCSPEPSAPLKKGELVDISGYAYSGSGRGIQRVDVSLDGGESWRTADLLETGQEAPKEWSWRRWTFTMDTSELGDAGEVEVIVKATDTSCNVQPSNPRDVWNIRGILNNSWHRVSYKLT